MFLEKGADVTNGQIDNALSKNLFDTALLLSEYNADVQNPQDYLCSTYENNYPDLFVYLLKNGADPYEAKCAYMFYEDPLYSKLIEEYSTYRE